MWTCPCPFCPFRLLLSFSLFLGVSWVCFVGKGLSYEKFRYVRFIERLGMRGPRAKVGRMKVDRLPVSFFPGFLLPYFVHNVF
uniref:Secreted protein n=1 Tax=Ascaris lumbricoides TaxID=6252 RepID=A0A0M3IVI2_ASCLU